MEKSVRGSSGSGDSVSSRRHRPESVVLDAELQRAEGPEVAVEDDFAQGQLAHVLEEAEVGHGQLEQVVQQVLQRVEGLAQHEEALGRRLLVQLLFNEGAPDAVIRELRLHVLAEDHLLVAVRVLQVARDADGAVDGVAHVGQLLVEVPRDERPAHARPPRC